MTEKLQFLESFLGKSHKANRDYYQFSCPFCNHYKPKLGISLGTGIWKCWVCPNRGSSISTLLFRLKEPKQKISIAKELWKEKVYFEKQIENKIELPKEFIPLWEGSGSFFHKKAIGFLESRNVTDEDIFKHRLGYCSKGKYSDMIIFPSYSEDNQLVFWSGRTFNEQSYKKFVIPENIDKNLILDENLINWSEPLIIVESKLDAITVKRNAIYLSGKKITEALKIKIVEERTPEIIFCLDGDALNDAILQSEYFIQNGIKVKKVRLPINEDPSSLGYEKIWKFINDAQIITEAELFYFTMMNKL